MMNIFTFLKFGHTLTNHLNIQMCPVFGLKLVQPAIHRFELSLPSYQTSEPYMPSRYEFELCETST